MSSPTARVALVTGGASGMGQSIARHLVRLGHRVAVVDVDAEAARAQAGDLQEDGGRAVGHGADVSDRVAVDRAFEAVRDELGPVEILITSAAIAPFHPFAEITADIWERVMAVNLTGTFNCLQAAVGDMGHRRWGRIVTIASSAVQVATPNHAHYAASKGGVVMLTRAVAFEYARLGVTANVILPHMIDTPMFRRARAEVGDPTGDGGASRIPVGRLGTGDDIAAACMYLCSDAAEFITGQTFGVNGGAFP